MSIFSDSIRIYSNKKTLFNVKGSQANDSIYLLNSILKKSSFKGNIYQFSVFNYSLERDKIKHIVQDGLFEKTVLPLQNNIHTDSFQKPRNNILLHLSFDANGFLCNNDTLFFIQHGKAFIKDTYPVNKNYINLEKKAYLISNKGVELYNNFTISLLFKPKTHSAGQVLYYQKGKDNRFLKLAFDKEKIYFQFSDNQGNSNTIFAYDSISINKWNHIVVSYHAGTFKFFFNGEKIKETNIHTINIRESQKNDTIYIGKGKYNFEYFTGSIDNFTIYNKAITEQEVENIHKNKQTSTHLNKELVNFAEKITTNYSFKNRINYIQDTIYVNSNKIKLKIWDYDKIDNDSISIFVNSDSIKSLRLRSWLFKKRIKINLAEKENYILLYSLFEGNYGENTLKIKAKYDITHKKSRKIITSKDTNGVVLFITKIHEKKIYEDTTSSDVLHIKIWDTGNIDNDAITVILNGKKIIENEYIYASNEQEAFEYEIKLLKNKKNKIIFIAADEGKFPPCTIHIKIKELNQTVKPRPGKKRNEYIIINQRKE